MDVSKENFTPMYMTYDDAKILCVTCKEEFVCNHRNMPNKKCCVDAGVPNKVIESMELGEKHRICGDCPLKKKCKIENPYTCAMLGKAENEGQVDMMAMKRNIQAMLLKARQEMVETNSFTQFAAVCMLDAIFYLVEMSGPVPEVIPAPYVMRTDGTDDIGVCKSTGNYCTGCNPGPCEHRK